MQKIERSVLVVVVDDEQFLIHFAVIIIVISKLEVCVFIICSLQNRRLPKPWYVKSQIKGEENLF